MNDKIIKTLTITVLILIISVTIQTMYTVRKLDKTVDVITIHINELTKLSTEYLKDEYSDEAKELVDEAVDSIKARTNRLLNLNNE